MLNWRWSLLVLALLTGWLQYRLWYGPGNAAQVQALQEQVDAQQRENEGLQQRNDALTAEVLDLKDGESAIEERARNELGMIRPGEKFYRVVESTAQAPVGTPSSGDVASTVGR